MSFMLTESQIPASRGLFKGKPLILGRPRLPRDQTLPAFLKRDTGEEIYVRRYKIYGHGALRLSLTAGDGNPVKDIFGLTDLVFIDVVIVEETLGSGNKRKVLYGWGAPQTFGIKRKARIRYVISERKRRGKWKILARPKALSGLSERQQAVQSYQVTIDAVTKGLGGKTLRRWWKVVYDRANGLSYVCYWVGKRARPVYGFDGLKKVFSVITEEKDRIVARFYEDEQKASKQEGLLKIAVLSERERHGFWVPLEAPKVIFTLPVNEFQYNRIKAQQLQAFLLGDQEEGTTFEIEPRQVDQGLIRLTVGARLDQEHGGFILLSGYSRYHGKLLPGRVVVKGDRKTVYFWEDPESREKGLPAIKPRGQVIGAGHKKPEGEGYDWEIKWRSSPLQREKVAQTLEYGNYLFASVGKRTRASFWPVYSDPGRLRPYAYKEIRGERLRLPLPVLPGRALPTRVFSVAREIQGKIKLVEYWWGEEDYGQLMPFAARFITLRQNGSGWAHFWVKMDDYKSFRLMKNRGFITLEELNAVSRDDYLVDRYGANIALIVDKFSLYELA